MRAIVAGLHEHSSFVAGYFWKLILYIRGFPPRSRAKSSIPCEVSVIIFKVDSIDCSPVDDSTSDERSERRVVSEYLQQLCRRHCKCYVRIEPDF